MKKIFLKLFTVVPLVACSQNIFSQTVMVMDKTTLQPLYAVTISGKNSQAGAVTNAKGEADISALKNTDSIRFSFVGYQDRTMSFNEIENKGFKIFLSEKSYFLGELVVSASRFEEKKEDVAQQIQVMKSRDLQFMNQSSAADVIQQSGNVLVQKSQAGGGSPVIRGFEANKVLIVVDGVRMNNAIYRGGHLHNIITIDNSMLEKTEIVFGPGSVVYGSDALGGVMHFYTKNPLLSDSAGKKRAGANAFTRYATVNSEKTGHADFSLGFKKIAFLTGFTYSVFGDLASGKNQDDIYDKRWKRTFYVERVNGNDSVFSNPQNHIQKPSGYTQYDLFEKVLFKQSEKISHTLNFQYSNSSVIPRYDRLTELSGTKPKFAEWYYGPQKKLFGSYAFNFKTDSAFADNIRIIFAYQDIEESRHDRKFNNHVRNNRTENLSVVTANADFDKKIKKNELRYGAESTFNNVSSSAFAENIVTGEQMAISTRYPDGGSTMNSFAAYFTHTLELSPKMIISDGLRASYVMLDALFNDTTFYPFPFSEVNQKSQAVNGNLGLIFKPGKEWRFSLLGSTGFRAPNVDDLSKIFESVPGKVIVPNPGLQPEKTYNGEVTVSKGFNEAVRIEITGYYSRYNNAISTGRATFNGMDSIIYNGAMSEVLSPLNKAEAFIYGSSWSLVADAGDNFSFSGSLNTTTGKIKTDTTDAPLDHIPPVFGKTGFQLKINRFRSEFFILYNGAKKLEDYNFTGEDNFDYATPSGMPPWSTLNARASFQFSKNFQLLLACENILDRHYRVFASGISGPGRNFVTTLRATI